MHGNTNIKVHTIQIMQLMHNHYNDIRHSSYVIKTIPFKPKMCIKILANFLTPKVK